MIKRLLIEAFFMFFYVYTTSIPNIQYLHPRNDPNTKQLHLQAKDRGVVVYLTIGVSIHQIGNPKDCVVEENSVLRMITTIGLALKHMSSKMNYVTFISPILDNQNQSNRIGLRRNSPCFMKYFKNLMDVTIIDSSHQVDNKHSIDISILIQSTMKAPIVPIMRGNINILVLSNIYESYMSYLSSIPSVLRHLSIYDMIVTEHGKDSEVYPAMLRHAFLSYSASSSSNSNNTSVNSKESKFPYFLPFVTYVDLPLPDQVIEASVVTERKYRDISVLVGTLSNRMTVEIMISQVFQGYITLKKRLFPLYNMTLRGDGCNEKIMGKLHILAYRSETELNLEAIAKETGVLSCQYSIVDRMKKEDVLRSLSSSSILWIVEDIFQISFIESSCLFPTIEISPKASLMTEKCEYYDYIQTVYTYREILHSAMSVGCIPIVLHTSTDSYSRNIWAHKLQLHHYQNGYITHSFETILSYSQQFLTAPFKQYDRLETAGRNTVSERLTEDAASLSLANTILGGILEKSFRVFINTTIDIVRSYDLSPVEIKHSIIRTKQSNLIQKPNGLIAMIIEPRINYAVEYAIRNVMHHLGTRWSLRVYYSTGIQGNEEFLRFILSDIPNIDYQVLPEAVVSGDDYSTFLKSSNLWRGLSLLSSRVLIFQSDSLIIKKGVEEFLVYDYIGAPWHMTEKTSSFAWLKKMQRFGYLKSGIGNGGFSIRNPELMMNISNDYSKGSGNLNEDLLFAIYTEKLSLLNNQSIFPTRRVAYEFALETPCDDIKELIIRDRKDAPFAIHAAWNYVDVHIALFLFNLSLIG